MLEWYIMAITRGIALGKSELIELILTYRDRLNVSLVEKRSV